MPKGVEKLNERLKLSEYEKKNALINFVNYVSLVISHFVCHQNTFFSCYLTASTFCFSNELLGNNATEKTMYKDEV